MLDNPVINHSNDVVAGYLFALGQLAVVAANVQAPEDLERVILGMIRETRASLGPARIQVVMQNYQRLGF